MLGQLLDGRYNVVRVLAAGGMGQTYVAEDTQLPSNPKCLVKQLKPINSDPNFLVTASRLFAGEAEMLDKLGKHDQIPHLLAHFERDGEFYIVQEFIDGQPLSVELPLGQRWTEAQVVDLLKDVLEILEFIHGQGVIHRDIKPDNIVRRKRDGKLVLIDFGAVKQVRVQQATAVGQVSLTVGIGTLGYMPTEQASGQPRPSSDIYALGKVSIQALTGLFPSQLREDEDGDPIWRDQADVKDGLAGVLTKMTRHYFRHRYQSASEVLQALKELEIPNKVENKGYTPTIVVENNSSSYRPTSVASNQMREPFKSPKLRYLKSKQLKEENRSILSVSIGVPNSTAAIFKDGQIVTLANIPSTIAYTHEGSCLAGEEAMQQLTSNISNTFANFIYFIGRSYDEISQLTTQTPYRVTKGSNDRIVLECPALNKWFFPEELLTELLCEVLNQCGDELDSHFRQIVITIPPFLNSIFCRENIKKSAEAAGIEVMRIIDETLAYGLACCYTNSHLYLPSSNTYLVIVADEFYIACCVLEIGDGVIETLCRFLRYVTPGTFSSPDGYQLLIEAVEDSLQSAKVTDVDMMVLPVNISKLPALQAIYYRKLADKAKEIIWSKNVAAYGTALQAGVLMGEVKNLLILDDNSLDLSVWTKQGLTNMISSSTTYPTKKSKLFLWNGDSPQIIIPIIEGESEKHQENRVLGAIYFDVAKTHQLSVIETIFDTDANNVLTVTTINKINGNSKSLTVTSRELLSYEEASRLYDNKSLLIRAIEGQAIWHGSAADTLVEIEGLMGVENGEFYLRIKGSKTGIKLREIEFIASPTQVEEKNRYTQTEVVDRNSNDSKGSESEAKRRVKLDINASIYLTLGEMEKGLDKYVILESGAIIVRIPKKIKVGQRIRIRGKGNLDLATQQRGDLYLEVKINKVMLWRDRKLLVAHRRANFPARCVKTNLPTNSRLTISWWEHKSFVATYSTPKKVLNVGISQEYLNDKKRANLKVKSFDEDFIWIEGVCESYLSLLPNWNSIDKEQYPNYLA